MKVLLLLIIFAAQPLAPARNLVHAQEPPRPVLTPVRPAPTPPRAHVEVVLYSDFQCPFCAVFARTFRELQAKGVEGVETGVRFKHFPLDALHPSAQLAHMASLAAGEQGKFWEMHDLLFADQSSLTRARAVQLAAQLGLGAARFDRDLDSDRLRQVIADDRGAGQRLGVQGTPTFFVNGRRYTGARSFEQLQQIVKAEAARMAVLAEVGDQLLSRGPAEAPVTVEFFADLQSPVTRPAVAVLDEAVRKYPSKVRIQFRNFPLSFHPQAPLAHEAAMAAASQGRFWELLSFILDHQESLREQDLIAQAGRLGLDRAKFAESLVQHRFAPRVEVDLEAGLRRGLRGSPVLFINGRRIDGVPSLEKIIQSIESELAAAHEREGASRP
ncbi:MAG: thioredoxin domain-containing protein [Pyrinomonadaceae bacterium]